MSGWSEFRPHRARAQSRGAQTCFQSLQINDVVPCTVWRRQQSRNEEKSEKRDDFVYHYLLAADQSCSCVCRFCCFFLFIVIWFAMLFRGCMRTCVCVWKSDGPCQHNTSGSVQACIYNLTISPNVSCATAGDKLTLVCIQFQCFLALQYYRCRCCCFVSKSNRIETVISKN